MEKQDVSENSEDAFTESKSPYDGHCNISPNNGTSLETTFTISCQDWKSSVGPLQYHVWLRRQANEDKLLSFGSVPEFHLLLAAGDESTHYMVNITVEIIDLHKASTSFQLYVQVFPSVESAQELLFNLTSGENSKLDELSVKDDTQALVQLISILGESMNKAQGKEAKNETTVNGTKTEALQQRTQELALQSFSQMTNFLEAESKEEIEETSTAILSALRQEINQTGNVTVDIDTSDITLSSSIKKEASIISETLEKAIQKASSAASVTGEKQPTSIETRFNSILSKQNLADLNGLKISESSSNSLDVFDGLSLTKVEAKNNTDNLNSLNISAPSFNSLYLFDGLNFTNNKAKNNTDDLNVLNLNIVETNITSNSSSIISLLKLFDLGNSSRVAD